MAAPDIDSSGLAQAVGAVDVSSSSTAPVPTSCIKETLVNSSGLDSGYVSRTSSPGDSKSGTGLVDRTVEGGRNIWPGPFRRPKPLPRRYNKPIPLRTQERFSDLRELYAENLNNFTRNLPNCQGVLMSLQVLGENEETAEPWVFVQCDKAIFKRVNKFFKQPFVKMDFEPPNPTDLSPRLRILVHPLSPKQLAKISNSTSQHASPSQGDLIGIFGRKDAVSSGILCGTQIMNETLQELRKATIGGIITVKDREGQTKVFGMTSGHFLFREIYQGYQDEFGDDLEDDSDDEEESFELDLDSLDADIDTAPDGIDGVERDDPVVWSKIGDLLLASHTCLEEGRNLDWALTTIDPSVSALNMVMSLPELNQFGPCVFDAPEKEVIVISSRGPLFGTFSRSLSYMMLPPGNVLVPTYLISLSDDAFFKFGDSGAWVIDADTNVVYGHVVASDVFGRGYVVPICDSFEDIKNRLSAQSVSLPFAAELATSNPHRSQQQAISTDDDRLALPPGQCAPVVNPSSEDEAPAYLLQEVDPEDDNSPQHDDPPEDDNPPLCVDPLQDIVYAVQQMSARQPPDLPSGHSDSRQQTHQPSQVELIKPSSTADVEENPDSGYSTMQNSPDYGGY